MPLPRPSLTLLFLLAISLAHPVAAVRCGDTLTADTTLTGSLHCTGQPFALRIAAPGITLKLDGHTITSDGTGVVLEHADGASLWGPGAIAGPGCIHQPNVHGSGIVVVDSDQVTIGEVSVRKHVFGIQIAGSSDARVSHNSIRDTAYGVWVSDTGVFGSPAPRNQILHNTIASQHCGLIGVQLADDSTRDSVVIGNRIEDMFQGIVLSSAANRVEGNTVFGSGVSNGVPTGVGIRIAGASDNALVSNRIEGMAVGVHVSTLNGYYAAAGISDALANRIELNSIRARILAVMAGDQGTGSPYVVKGNLIRQNRLLGESADLVFERNAHWNDARGNVLSNPLQPVIDRGAGNRWP